MRLFIHTHHSPLAPADRRVASDWWEVVVKMASRYQCQVTPEPDHSYSFRLNGREVVRWNEGLQYPRPYFYPLIGPSGQSLTRMGHPGAPNHDHHQSVWFAHHKVTGIDFWANGTGAIIRQSQWLAMEDRDDFCRLAVELLWSDGHDPAPLLNQHMICEMRPIGDQGEFVLEIQSEFSPAAELLEFQKTNFGFLAVRVSKELSAHFGGGVLSSSAGLTGEPNLFGKAAAWVDYSGQPGRDPAVLEGITYFDHPSNPGQPTGWHVRDDGWMCASPTMNQSLVTQREAPLLLRYLLLVHSGKADPERNMAVLSGFTESPRFWLRKSDQPHTQWMITRSKE